jgi:hypothetical protein
MKRWGCAVEASLILLEDDERYGCTHPLSSPNRWIDMNGRIKNAQSGFRREVASWG